MKTIACFLLILVVVSTNIAYAQETQCVTPSHSASVYIRSSAGFTTRLGALNIGEIAQIESIEGVWYKLYRPGLPAGFVHSSVVTIISCSGQSTPANPIPDQHVAEQLTDHGCFTVVHVGDLNVIINNMPRNLGFNELLLSRLFNLARNVTPSPDRAGPYFVHFVSSTAEGFEITEFWNDRVGGTNGPARWDGCKIRNFLHGRTAGEYINASVIRLDSAGVTFMRTAHELQHAAGGEDGNDSYPGTDFFTNAYAFGFVAWDAHSNRCHTRPTEPGRSLCLRVASEVLGR